MEKEKFTTGEIAQLGMFWFRQDEVRLDKQAGWEHLESQKAINADNRIAA